MKRAVRAFCRNFEGGAMEPFCDKFLTPLLSLHKTGVQVFVSLSITRVSKMLKGVMGPIEPTCLGQAQMIHEIKYL